MTEDVVKKDPKDYFYYGIHNVNASTWMEQGPAKLCDMIMKSNNGLTQQIMDNKTELMDILSKDELEKPVDDLGLTLPFLCVW